MTHLTHIMSTVRTAAEHIGGALYDLGINDRDSALRRLDRAKAAGFTSVVVAPRLQHRFGTVPTLVINLLALTATLAVMAIGTDTKAVLATCVVVAGLFIGINNTLITETVMKAAPVERGVASAAYSFLRFGGAAVAPWLAGVLGEQVNVHLPYWVGAAAVLAGAALLFAARGQLAGIDAPESRVDELTDEATAVTVGS